ncbi:hypothetical protein C8R46DRAFT_1223181 [Mycena filopes]|nr:hypothetical protein C8R46DRAFT_1223181 [Mycena filopes]
MPIRNVYTLHAGRLRAHAGNVKNAASTALLELGGVHVSPVNASWTTPASLWIPRPGTLSTTTTIPNGLVVPSSVATVFLSPSSKSTFPQFFAGFTELTSTAPAVTFAKLSKDFTVEQYGQTLINLLSARVEALVALEDE